MKVSLEKLTQAMYKVKGFADGQKNVPGVMLDVAADKMKLCYSDGKKSIIEIIDIEAEEGEALGRIIVPYTRIMGIIDICQPSGPVYTGDFEILFGENKTMVIKAVKKVQIAGDGDSIEEKTVSKFEQRIGYQKPEESIQYGVLSRMNYESIFESESFDIWDKEELRSILDRTSKEKSKIIYVSSIQKAAFVANLSHVTKIPIDSCENHGFTITTAVATSLVDILGRTPGDKVSICIKETRYANIVSEDNSVGVWFELAPGSKTDLGTLERYQEKKYEQYKLVFNRPALENVINCAMSSDSNEKTKLTFANTEDGSIVVKIATHSGGSTVDNDFAVVAEMYKDNVGDLLSTNIPVSLKVIKDMVSNCREVYIAFDVATEDSGKGFIRIGDIDLDTLIDNDIEKLQLMTTHYTVASK